MELIEIFCKERNSLFEYMKKRHQFFTYDDDALLSYFIDLWIKDARQCDTLEKFDALIRKSMRMSFNDWFSGL